MTDTTLYQTPSASTRIAGLDVMRFAVLIPIIAAHALSQTRYHIDVLGLIDNCGRFIVPFFFALSGYFLGRRTPSTQLGVMGLAVRLLPAFLFWLFIYLAVLGELGRFFTDPLFLIKCLYYGGPAFHLWFLPALGMSAALVLLTRPLGYPAMACIGLVLYCIGLVTNPYVNVAGFPDMPVLFETGPFYGYLLVLAGYYIGAGELKPSLRDGWILFISGILLQLAEAYFIFTTGNGPFAPHIFLIGTAPLGLGAFILSMHMPNFEGSKLLAKFGRVGLGIYCCHVLFLLWLEPYFDKGNAVEALMLIGAVTLLSTLLCLALARIPYVRKVVE